MIDLTIGKKTYRHPSKIEEVTLDQWIKLSEVEHDESKTVIENNLLGFSAFANIPMKVLLSAPKEEMMYHVIQVTEMLNQVEADKTPIDSFKIGRTTYYVTQDIDNALIAQYIDCTHRMKQLNSEAVYYPYMMAVYCLKKGEKYGFDLEERAKIMRKARAVDAIKVNAFFLTTSRSYLRDFRHYMVTNQQTNNSKPDAKT